MAADPLLGSPERVVSPNSSSSQELDCWTSCDIRVQGLCQHAAGAYLLGVPNSVDPQPNNGTFWKSLPGGLGLFWPMFIVAILAAIVASQALISAVFQIAYQAIAQGFFPRFHVYHTSRKHKGQVWKIPTCSILMPCLQIIVQLLQRSCDPLAD